MQALPGNGQDVATTRLRLLCAGLIAALAALAAGCTGTAEEQEATRQQELARAFAPAFADTSSRYRSDVASIQDSGRSALREGDQDAVLDVYRALRDAAAAAADEFDDIEPPSRVRAQHESLVENLRNQHQALDDIVAAADAQRAEALTEGLQDLASLLADFATIHGAIDQELTQQS